MVKVFCSVFDVGKSEPFDGGGSFFIVSLSFLIANFDTRSCHEPNFLSSFLLIKVYLKFAINSSTLKYFCWISIRKLIIWHDLNRKIEMKKLNIRNEVNTQKKVK